MLKILVVYWRIYALISEYFRDLDQKILETSMHFSYRSSYTHYFPQTLALLWSKHFNVTDRKNIYIFLDLQNEKVEHYHL